MTSTKLPLTVLNQLRPLEDALRKAVAQQDPEAAINAATRVQALFKTNRTHHRLLRAKLWAFEACIDANRLAYAEPGLIGVRRLASRNTRLYLEASALLAVTKLRQKKANEAKELIREVVDRINAISSDRTRHKFQSRFIERIEEECIFAELVDTGGGQLDVKEIEANAIVLVQRSSDDEIYRLIGNSVPAAGLLLLSDVRSYAILQLPAPDRRLLPAPEKAQEPKNVGRTTFSLLRRIAWKTFCKPDSPIYKLWSKRVPKVFNDGYFAAAVVTTMSDFRIGVPMLASGLAALAMKYSAEEFCSLAKPKGLMMGYEEKSDKPSKKKGSG